MKRFIVLITLILALAGCTAVQPLTSTPFIDTGIDANAWAQIPAGDFYFGRHNEVVTIPADYEIMVTMVTNDQYAVFLNQALSDGTGKLVNDQVVSYYPGDPFQGVKHEEEIKPGDWPWMTINTPGAHLNFSNGEFSVQPGFENHPVAAVTWFGANAYCLANDWRLPSEAEWEKAARGTDERAYPWGNSIEANQANYYNSGDLFEKIMGKQGDTTPVGYYSGKTYADGYTTLAAVSPYGLYDMAGNLWQWTGDDYPGVHYRYLRGGSKADYAYNMRVWSRNNASPQTVSIHFGFRCAREVAP